MCYYIDRILVRLMHARTLPAWWAMDSLKRNKSFLYERERYPEVTKGTKYLWAGDKFSSVYMQLQVKDIERQIKITCPHLQATS